MEKPIIQINNLGKRYNITHRQGGYIALRDVMANVLKNPFKFVHHKTKQIIGKETKEEFWALRNINLNINSGEIIGIIGRNGAGKSTLLKILTGITPPTEGEIITRGRIASLLEVGTGFHPELTGRENIFLNGAILGMTKKEIINKFDEIVEFSGIKKFLDTPVKYYSSGMYVRLAFSVAAHMEPDILLVDEVLAVGDAEFQKKCLGKMDEVTKKQGRTVLFVSHNMAAINRICQRAILLDKGNIVMDGPSQRVVETYMHSKIGPNALIEWSDVLKAPGNDIVRLRAVRVKQDNKITDSADIRLPIGIEMEFEVVKPGYVLFPNYHFDNEEGIKLFVASDCDPEWKNKPRPKGIYKSTAWVPGNFLSEGRVLVSAAISTISPNIIHFFERDVVALNVVDSYAGDSARGDYMGTVPGIIRPLLTWNTEFSENLSKSNIIKQ